MTIPIPDLFPDELLISMFARLNDRLRARPSRLGDLLFGSPASCLDWTIPNGLARLERLLPPSFQPTVDEMIEAHTLYRFYRVLLPHTTGTLWQEMQKGGDPAFDASLSNYRNLTGVPVLLRYCPVCAKEDKRHFGEFYWHRTHQTPGVFVCHAHYVFLNESNVPAYAIPSRSCLNMSAHTALQTHKPRALNTSLSSHATLLSIADTLVKLARKQTASQVITSMRPHHLRSLPYEAWNILDPPKPSKTLIPREQDTTTVIRQIPTAFAGQAWTKNLV